MTQLVALTQRSDFEAALHAARRIGEDAPLTGLAAPLDGIGLGRLNDAWDAIESALRRAYERGLEAAREQIESALRKTDEALQSAGDRSRELYEALVARLQEYLSTFVDRALGRVRAAVSIAGRELPLSGIDLQQTISLAGSLKASVQEICAMTATGQLVVTARYGAVDERMTGPPAA